MYILLDLQGESTYCTILAVSVPTVGTCALIFRLFHVLLSVNAKIRDDFRACFHLDPQILQQKSCSCSLKYLLGVIAVIIPKSHKLCTNYYYTMRASELSSEGDSFLSLRHILQSMYIPGTEEADGSRRLAWWRTVRRASTHRRMIAFSLRQG